MYAHNAFNIHLAYLYSMPKVCLLISRNYRGTAQKSKACNVEGKYSIIPGSKGLI